MGTEELKLTEHTTFAKGKELLKDFQCSQKWCGLFIDDKDIQEHNYQFEISDYANDISKSENGTYTLTFWLRIVNHQECPDNERCQSCYKKFRTNQLKEKEDYYYCASCQPQAGFTEKEVKHE